MASGQSGDGDDEKTKRAEASNGSPTVLLTVQVHMSTVVAIAQRCGNRHLTFLNVVQQFAFAERSWLPVFFLGSNIL